MSDLRIATRRSRLALAQARRVQALLALAHPGVETSLVEVESSGDVDRTTSISTLTELGAFVRAIQQAVIDGRADLAVHSCKDLPTAGPPGLIQHYPERDEPWDVIVGSPLDELPDGARVGTGSPRRKAQLLRLRDDLTIDEIRGNVDTRIDRVGAGDFAAVVLAEAGLRRLGRSAEIAQRLTVDEMVPAPGQAALVIETSDDSDGRDLVAAIDDPDTRATVEAERALLARTGAGCRAALGALARLDGDGVSMWGFVEDEEGARSGMVTAPSPGEASRSLQQELGL